MTDAPALSPETEIGRDADRVRRAMTAWRRRSRLIRFWRRALPASIALILVGMAGWVAWRSVATDRQDLGDSQVVRLVNARFYGQDARGRQFVLGAAEATRPLKGDTSRVTLRAPTLEIDQNGDPVRLTSRSGVYDEKTMAVRLTGDVKVVEPSSGFVMTTPEAVADTAAGVVAGDESVTAAGPLGRVDAKSYAIYDQGARIVFRGDGTLEGRVKSRIERKRR